MKRIILLALLSLGLLSWKPFKTSVDNDLNNTKWSGIVNAPDPVDAVFEFRNDSLMLSINDQIIETMSYKTNGDSLVMKKLFGNSPCTDEEAIYIYRITKDVLVFTPVEDTCPERSAAFNEEGYKKLN